MVFIPNRLISYDKNSIITEILRVSKQFFNGDYPTTKQFDRHAHIDSSTVIRKFSSWSAAMKAAGFHNYSQSRIKRSEIIADIKGMLSHSGGKYFTESFYKQNGGKYNVKTIKSRLGYSGWQEMLEKELTVRLIRKIIIKKPLKMPHSQEELFQELEDVWNKLKRRPTYSEFKKISCIGIKAYERLFGCWTNAIEKFSSVRKMQVSWVKGTRYSKAMLLQDIKTIAGKSSGKILSFEDYQKLGGTFPISTFQWRFGSWKKVIASLGLKDGTWGRKVQKKYSDEDFFAEIQRVWELLGRQPEARKMKKYNCKMSVQSFQKRFGGWTKAIYAFCKNRGLADETNSTPPPPQPNILELSKHTTTPDVVNITNNEDESIPGNTSIQIQMRTPRIPSLRLRFKVLERDSFSCRTCGRSPAKDPNIILHADHIIAYSSGGETILDNLQTLCSICNIGKSNL